MMNMPVLLVDNSNTRTKFRVYANGALQDEQRVLPTAELGRECINNILRGWQFRSAVVCSVVPPTAAIIAASLDVPVRFIGVETAADWVDFSQYPGRATLGADRVANSVAVAAKGILPVVAVDLGTAITFDVLVEGKEGKPCFAGGIIAPGFATIRHSFVGRTALLPEVTMPEELPLLGMGTEQALLSGIGLTCRGLVRETLCSIESYLGVKPYVVAVGGDAEWASSQLNLFDEIDPLLTFRGMLQMIQNESLL